MLPSKEGECNTRDHRSLSSGPNSSHPVARALFNIAQFPKTASCFFLVFH